MLVSQFWFEVVKLLIGAATPIVVAILGVSLLRRIESVKSLVARQSDFQKKWADEFVSCCHAFLQSLERDLALMTVLSGLSDPNSTFGLEMQRQISQLTPTLSELELRVRRSVVFAPVNGAHVNKAAHECVSLLGTLLKAGAGSVDGIILKMNEFNVASRDAHAEMLGVEAAAQPQG